MRSVISYRNSIATMSAIALATLAVTSAFVVRRSFASDHADEPSIAADPPVDIGDVYAFMRPEGTAPSFTKSGHLVMAMTVAPNADATSTFALLADYTFSIAGLDESTMVIGMDETGDAGAGLLDAAISCRFYAATGTNADGLPMQPFSCAANGAFFSGVTNEVSGASTDALRVFAGLRADPAFADVPGVLSRVRSGQLPSADAGATNTFAGKNALVIVADIDVKKTLVASGPADGGPRYLGVSAWTGKL